MSGSPVLVMQGESTLCKLAGMLVRGDAQAKRGYFVNVTSLQGYVMRVAFKDPKVVRRFLKSVPRALRTEMKSRMQFLFGFAKPGSEHLRRRKEAVGAALRREGIDWP